MSVGVGINTLTNENLDLATRKQIHEISLPDLKKENLDLYNNILIKKYLNLSFTQLLMLTINDQMNSIARDNMPSDLFMLLDFIGNVEEFSKFYPVCNQPERYSIQSEKIMEMPEIIKLVYFCNFVEKIPNEYKFLFKETIQQVFGNPSLFCQEIFSIIINTWPKDLITSIIDYIEINGFPKKYLKDLFMNYDLPQRILDRFRINDLNEVENVDDRIYIFNKLLDHYNQTTNVNQIHSININNLNNQQIKLLIEKCNINLLKNQVEMIDLLQLSHETLLLLLGNHVNDISLDQVNVLDFLESDVAQIIVESNHLYNLSDQQIQTMIISQINDNAVQRLIKHLCQKDKFNILHSNQIQNIKLELVDINAQYKFIHDSINDLSENQIGKINFSLYNDQKVIQSILQSLNSVNKLGCLVKEQVEQINVYGLDDNELVESMFLLPRFSYFFTNNSLDVINDDTFQLIDFSNVENNFLNYVVDTMLDKFSNNQINQINFELLQQKVLEKLLIKKMAIINDNLIQSLKVQEMPSNVLDKLISEKINVLNKDQIENLQINKLNIKSQLSLLQTRLNDLTENQYQHFNTTNVNITKILLQNKFNYMNQEQINSVPFSELDINEQALILDQKNIFFKDLNPSIIQACNLPKLREFKYDIYFDLLLLKPQYLTTEQLMTVNWLTDTVNLLITARIFIKKIGAKKELEKHFLSKEQITREDLEKMPNELLVSLLNSKFLSNQHDFISLPLRSCFVKAIQIMFKSSSNYLYSVEYIINNWTEKSQKLIAPIIKDLKIAKFSDQTRNSLLDFYLFDLKDEQLQSLNLSTIPEKTLKNSIINRANHFNPKQFKVIPFSYANNIYQDALVIQREDEQIQLIDIPSLNNVFVNYLVKNKLNFLQNRQIRLINIHGLIKECFNSLFQTKLNVLANNQIKQIKIENLNNDELNTLLINRSSNISRQQINKIPLGTLSNIALSNLLMNKLKKLSVQKIKKELTSQMLNSLELNVLLTFLNAHVNNLTLSQIQQLNITIPEVAAILFEKCVESISINQIHMIDKNLHDLINKKMTYKNLGLVYNLAKAKRLHSLTPKQLNDFFNYYSLFYIRGILEENLQDLIEKNNIQKIFMDNIKELSKENYMKLLNSFIEKFSDNQIHVLDTKNLNTISIILEKNLQSKLTHKQIQSIELDHINEQGLCQLIKDKSPDFSQVQIKKDCITNLLPRLGENHLLVFLQHHIAKLEIHQIQVIKTSSIKVSAMLLMHCANSLSNNQIQNMKLGKLLNDELTSIGCPNKCICIIRGIHRFKDLTNAQLNIIDYSITPNIVEIIDENLQDELNEKSVHLIRIKNFDYRRFGKYYIKLLDSFVHMFSNDQISHINVAKKDIASLLINKDIICRLSGKQMQDFNKEELIKCNDQQLVKFAKNVNESNNDNCIKSIGILLHKYLENKIINEEALNFINEFLSKNENNELKLAKYIMIAGEAYKSEGIDFITVAKKFFTQFSNKSVLLKENENIQFNHPEFEITPNDFKTIIFQKAVYWPDINKVSTVFNPSSEVFSQIADEYKSILSKIQVGSFYGSDGTLKKSVFCIE